MRILYITYDGILDPVSQSQVLPYLEGLSAAGNVFTLVSFEKRNGFHDNKLMDIYNDRMKKNAIEWIPMVYHKRPTVPATILDVFSGTIKAFRVIKRDGIGAVHARGYVPMLMAYILKKAAGVKVIFDMRGFWAEEKVDAGAWKKGGILYRIMKRMETAFLTSADEVVVLTNAAKAYLLERARRKSPITVIPCCVDLSLFKSDKTKDFSRGGGISGTPVILYAGSLGTFYNLDRVLDFFLFFKKRNPSAFLRVISHYSKEAMAAAALSRDIRKTWYSIEALDHSKMPGAFSEADFSVIFYNRRLSGMGCSPIKFAESLACGVPVVMNSGIGDCDDIVNRTNVGAVINDFSDEAYERASDKMCELMSKRGDAALRCTEAAKKFFSLDAGIETYRNIYQRLTRLNI